MDGNEHAAPVGSVHAAVNSPAPPAGWTTTLSNSNISDPILTGISIALLLYYIASRILWLYDNKVVVVDIVAEEEEPGAATTTYPSTSSSPPRAPSSSSPLPPISQPRRHAMLLLSSSLLPVLVPMAASSTTAGREKMECAVCLAEFGESGQAGRLLPRCGHAFHDECIMLWLKVNMTCPLCRAPVATK